MSIKQHLASKVKRLLYSSSGEPYEINGQVLRFVPGTRPVRVKYVDSNEKEARNDALQVQFLSNTLKEGDTYLDIGSHAGQYGLIASALCGKKGKVVCFEPDPFAREKLEKNLSLNPSIQKPQLVPIALSDSEGSFEFYTRGGDSRSSLQKDATGGGSEADLKKITVQTMTLDGWLAKTGVPTPKLVKIDTEGAEIAILKGAKNLLAQGKTTILCELHPFAWPSFQVSFDQFQQIIDQHRLKIRYINGSPVKAPGEYGTVVIERS